jgi:cell division protein FtsB
MSTRRRKRKEPAYREKLRQAGLFALGFLLMAVVMHGVFGPHGYLSMRHTQGEIGHLQDDLQRLNKENAELTGEIRALKSDPAAIERVARDDMGLARPGELIFRLPDDPPAPAQPSAAPPATQPRH